MSDVIGITMGDPAGVGPEICVRALAEMGEGDRARTRIYGNLPTLEAARTALGIDIDLTGHVVDLPVEGAAALKAAVITVVLHYSTTGPLA